MAKVLLSRTQLTEQLGRKIRNLDAACRRFDLGNNDEIDQIASVLRTLWHRGRSCSLMDRLAFCGSLLDATYECPPERIWDDGSQEGVGHRRAYIFGGHRDYAPALLKDNQGGGRQLPFDEWWGGEVARDASERVYSRKDMVLLVADKESAHVDGEYTDIDYDLRFQPIMPIVPIQSLPDGTAIIKKSSPVPFILRHIAFEVLHSLIGDYRYDGSIYYNAFLKHMKINLSHAK